MYSKFNMCCVICLVVQLCLSVCNPMDCSPPGSSVCGNSPGKSTRVGCHALLPTQWSYPGLLHCRWILYRLSHQGSPKILEWVAYPFSRESSWPRNWTGVSCIAGRFFTSWAAREAHSYSSSERYVSYSQKDVVDGEDNHFTWWESWELKHSNKKALVHLLWPCSHLTTGDLRPLNYGGNLIIW